MEITYKVINRFSPQIPDAKGHGWELKEGKLFSIMTDQLPAPKFSIEMNSCNCKKTKCLSRCSCAKNGLRCTDLCKCIGCENEDMRFTTISIDDEYSEQDEDENDDDDDVEQ